MNSSRKSQVNKKKNKNFKAAKEKITRKKDGKTDRELNEFFRNSWVL